MATPDTSSRRASCQTSLVTVQGGKNWVTLVLISSVDPHASPPDVPGKRVPIPSIPRTMWQDSATTDPAPNGMPQCAHPEASELEYHKHHSNLVRCNETPCLYGSVRPCARCSISGARHHKVSAQRSYLRRRDV